MKETILKIHESPFKIVLAITGGGAEAIGELLRHGNGSKTLLEAIVPYNTTAFNDFVKGIPDKYCSESAARDLAMAAFQRGVKLTNDIKNIVGIGTTSSLVKENERDGREHHVFVAIQTETHTLDYYSTLHGNNYSREDEETLTAEIILKALAHTCGALKYPPEKSSTTDEKIRNVVLGVKTCCRVEATSCQVEPVDLAWETGKVVFSGSFNPFHDQHAAMVSKASELTGCSVDLELCIRNVDKPALNYAEINHRLYELSKIGNLFENIYLTSMSTFAQKSEYFVNSTFVVGWDTFCRINDPKYGNLEKIIEIFVKNNTKFMVFQRGQTTDTTLIHSKLLEISKIYGPEVLTPVDISSTEIRRGRKNLREAGDF